MPIKSQPTSGAPPTAPWAVAPGSPALGSLESAGRRQRDTVPRGNVGASPAWPLLPRGLGFVYGEALWGRVTLSTLGSVKTKPIPARPLKVTVLKSVAFHSEGTTSKKQNNTQACTHTQGKCLQPESCSRAAWRAHSAPPPEATRKSDGPPTTTVLQTPDGEQRASLRLQV